MGFGLRRRRAELVSRFRNIEFRLDEHVTSVTWFSRGFGLAGASDTQRFGGVRRTAESLFGQSVSTLVPPDRTRRLGSWEGKERNGRFGGRRVGQTTSWRLRSAVSTRVASASRYRLRKLCCKARFQVFMTCEGCRFGVIPRDSGRFGGQGLELSSPSGGGRAGFARFGVS